MNVIIRNRSDFSKILTIKAADTLVEIFKNKDFWENIPEAYFFSHTEHIGKKITNDIRSQIKTGMNLNINFYYSSWFFRGVVGNVKNKYPDTININTRHFSFIINDFEDEMIYTAERIENIAHEFAHVCDNFSNLSYGHGDNSPSGKEKSFPWWFGKYAKEFFLKYYEIEVENV